MLLYFLFTKNTYKIYVTSIHTIILSLHTLFKVFPKMELEQKWVGQIERIYNRIRFCSSAG